MKGMRETYEKVRGPSSGSAGDPQHATLIGSATALMNILAD
jgi:hypothetical protein